MSNQIQSENIFFFKITAGCDGAWLEPIPSLSRERQEDSSSNPPALHEQAPSQNKNSICTEQQAFPLLKLSKQWTPTYREFTVIGITSYIEIT